jgi:hypothetical protein
MFGIPSKVFYGRCGGIPLVRFGSFGGGHGKVVGWGWCSECYVRFVFSGCGPCGGVVARHPRSRLCCGFGG